jgi:hypothetical protein
MLGITSLDTLNCCTSVEGKGAEPCANAVCDSVGTQVNAFAAVSCCDLKHSF